MPATSPAQSAASRCPRTSRTTTVLPHVSASSDLADVRSRCSLTAWSCSATPEAMSSSDARRRHLSQRVAHHPAGQLAVGVAAQSVGDYPEACRGPLQEGVLVHRPDAAHVGCRLRAHVERCRGCLEGHERLRSPRGHSGRDHVPLVTAPGPVEQGREGLRRGNATSHQATRLHRLRPPRPPDGERGVELTEASRQQLGQHRRQVIERPDGELPSGGLAL